MTHVGLTKAVFSHYHHYTYVHPNHWPYTAAGSWSNAVGFSRNTVSRWKARPFGIEPITSPKDRWEMAFDAWEIGCLYVIAKLVCPYKRRYL
jgi:hypothetical protein